MFKVMRGMNVLTVAKSKRDAIEAFNLLVVCGHKPFSVVNNHGTNVYSKDDYLKLNPGLGWCYK